jgi:phosphatidylserine/phosphatidylglycerophosphate/cardiolipin synthase-like enzyme
VYDTFSSLRLLELFGVKIRRQKHIKLHAKLILVDGSGALTGSMNIDRSAFDVRRELGIEVDAPAVLQRLEQTFRADWKASTPYSAPDPLDPTYHELGELPPDPHFVHH